MAEEPKTHINAAIIAGFIGLLWLIAIMVNFFITPPAGAAAGEEVQIIRGERITLAMDEWGFNGKQGGPIIEIPAGKEVEIVIINQGRNFHGFQVKAPDGSKLAGLDKDDTVDPGEERSIIIKIDTPGEYIYVCPVAGHEERGMRGIIRVV